MNIVQLRYIGTAPVLVTPLGRTVLPDELVKFPGTVVEPKDQPEGAIYIESGNPAQMRAWPITLWADETPVTSSKKEIEK